MRKCFWARCGFSSTLHHKSCSHREIPEFVNVGPVVPWVKLWLNKKIFAPCSLDQRQNEQLGPAGIKCRRLKNTFFSVYPYEIDCCSTTHTEVKLLMMSMCVEHGARGSQRFVSRQKPHILMRSTYMVQHGGLSNKKQTNVCTCVCVCARTCVFVFEWIAYLMEEVWHYNASHSPINTWHFLFPDFIPTGSFEEELLMLYWWFKDH